LPLLGRLQHLQAPFGFADKPTEKHC
jgi:hypothetical protein